jgi:hypothetical protein
MLKHDFTLNLEIKLSQTFFIGQAMLGWANRANHWVALSRSNTRLIELQVESRIQIQTNSQGSTNWNSADFQNWKNLLINRRNQPKIVLTTITRFGFHQKPIGFQNIIRPVLSKKRENQTGLSKMSKPNQFCRFLNPC